METVWLDCPVYQANCGKEPERLQFMLRILLPPMKKDLAAEDLEHGKRSIELATIQEAPI